MKWARRKSNEELLRRLQALDIRLQLQKSEDEVEPQEAPWEHKILGNYYFKLLSIRELRLVLEKT